VQKETQNQSRVKYSSLNYSLWLLGKRAYSEKQIREKLAKKEYPTEEIEATVKKLRDLKFLDDLEFARNFIRQATSSKPKGKYRLTMELSQKGVAKDLIEQAISENLTDESKLALDTLKRYGKKFARLDRQKRFEKSIRFLLARGFSYDDAKKAYRIIFN